MPRAVSAEPVNAITSSEVRCASRSPAPPQRRLSAPSGSTLAAITSLTMACASSAVDGRRLGEDRHAGQQRYRRLLPQAPAREVERIDVDRHAAPRHQQVDGLVVLGLGEPHRLFVEQRARVAQARPEPRVVFERADAAVDVDRRVDLGVAGIGDGDRLVARAVGGQDIGDRADQLGPLGIAHGRAARPARGCARTPARP